MHQIQIETVRALTDNYCYVVYRSGSHQALVIDPSEAGPIKACLEANDLNLGLILNTHHHHDHVGGNLALAEEFAAPIYCSKTDFARVPGATRGFKEGDVFDFDGIKIKVYEIPGHTHGQIAFYIRDAQALFVGDTVFSMGCGRLFEGTPSEMFASLSRIKAFEPETQIYFGHEYTETNGRFALSVEPGNAGIRSRVESVRSELQSSSVASAPTIADEIKVNPFLRANSAEIRKSLGLETATDVEVFTRLREMRNTFK